MELQNELGGAELVNISEGPWMQPGWKGERISCYHHDMYVLLVIACSRVLGSVCYYATIVIACHVLGFRC